MGFVFSGNAEAPRTMLIKTMTSPAMIIGGWS